MNYTYDIYVRIYPDSFWEFVFKGRVKIRSYIAYERYLSKLCAVLNESSVYEFKIISCYEKYKKDNRQLDCPF